MGIFDFFKPNIEKMKKRKDVEGLIKNLKHKDEAIRTDAAQALREIGNPRAIELLTHALSNEDTELQRIAGATIEKIEKDEKAKQIYEAHRVIDRAEYGLRRVGGWVSGEQKEKIERSIMQLGEAIDSEDMARMRTVSVELNIQTNIILHSDGIPRTDN